MNLFICGDTGQAPLFDRLAAEASDLGWKVVRGPSDNGREMKVYSSDEIATFIAPSDVAVFSVRHACTREVMAAAPRLRGICYPAIGVESLDLGAADELGLIVGHGAVRGNVIGMAEATVMLMLMLLYDVRTNIALLERGSWRRPGHHGHQFEGKTVGLIGFGRIAREVAARLEPFNVRLLTYSPRARQEDLPPGMEKVGLETLISESDIVSVLTGLTPETRGMIDAHLLARMKPSAYLVNTGRGAIVEESALVDALRAKQIAGAALDTFETEPLPRDNPLRSLPNVILTPHCVGHTIDGWEELSHALRVNVERIGRGEMPLHCKNPETETRWHRRLARLDAESRSAGTKESKT